jgi:Polyketide cyclase / dehydrase and lipid transport
MRSPLSEWSPHVVLIMIRIEQSIEVNRPVPEVFAFMSEPANLFKWSRATEEIRQLTPGAIQPGSRFEIISRFLGRRISSIITVSEYIENEKVSSQGDSGGMKLSSTTYYIAQGENTLMKMETELEPSGWWMLIAPFLPRMIRRRSAVEHNLLRESLESTIHREEKDVKVLEISRTIISVQ